VPNAHVRPRRVTTVSASYTYKFAGIADARLGQRINHTRCLTSHQARNGTRLPIRYQIRQARLAEPIGVYSPCAAGRFKVQCACGQGRTSPTYHPCVSQRFIFRCARAHSRFSGHRSVHMHSRGQHLYTTVMYRRTTHLRTCTMHLYTTVMYRRTTHLRTCTTLEPCTEEPSTTPSLRPSTFNPQSTIPNPKP
jgi:hypothetical protein